MGGMHGTLASERRALAATLRAVGPDAPTLIPGWTATDLAAHVAATEKQRGVPTFLGRRLVRRGVRLNDSLSWALDVDRRRFTSRGFEQALGRLERDGPALLERPGVLPVSVFEVVVHHEDVRRANRVPRDGAPPDLAPSIEWLLQYHRRLLGPHRLVAALADGRQVVGGGDQRGITVRGDALEVLLWLAGRQAAADVEVMVEDVAAAALADRLRV